MFDLSIDEEDIFEGNRSAQTITTADSNEETDSSLSDDFKSIQNSIISINRPSSIVLRRWVQVMISEEKLDKSYVWRISMRVKTLSKGEG